MKLLKHGKIVENDNWIVVADADPLPEEGAVIVTLARWLAERESLIGSNRPLGLALPNDKSPASIAEDLARFELIQLHFPKFNDGRAFSQARLLRERFGFAGEVRATGKFIRDQYLFLHRCGFDALQIEKGDAERDWVAALTEISLWYQPTGDGRASILELRHRPPLAAVAAE